jgi:hypothetical protein
MLILKHKVIRKHNYLSLLESTTIYHYDPGFDDGIFYVTPKPKSSQEKTD